MDAASTSQPACTRSSARNACAGSPTRFNAASSKPMPCVIVPLPSRPTSTLVSICTRHPAATTTTSATSAKTRSSRRFRNTTRNLPVQVLGAGRTQRERARALGPGSFKSFVIPTPYSGAPASASSMGGGSKPSVARNTMMRSPVSGSGSASTTMFWPARNSFHKRRSESGSSTMR